MGKHPEKVLGVARPVLESLLGGPLPRGIIPAAALPLGVVLEAAEFRVRDDVEADPSFKQLIPYIVLTRRESPNPPGVLTFAPLEKQTTVFTYARGAGGGEGRLHALRSLGVGGHVEEADFAGGVGRRDGFAAAIGREFNEELDMAADAAVEVVSTPLGYVNDDETAVGSVHLGVVQSFDVTTAVVAVREATALAEPDWEWAAVLARAEVRGRYESWSQIVIDHLWG